MAGGTIEIERERSAPELVSTTFSVYQRFPLLFLILAAGVVVPYELIVLAVTGAGPLSLREVSGTTSLILDVIDMFLIGPLISALHVHAVQEIRDGTQPRLASVASKAVTVLPVVIAAVIISWLGIILGFVALIVPGILLSLRWAVVAQSAALERGSWTDALRRSSELTRKNYWHVFGLLFLVGVISAVVTYGLVRAFGHPSTTVASFVAGTALQTVVRSFTALATALLYFDLTARSRTMAGSAADEKAPPDPEWDVPPTGHPLDPNSWSDEDRPPGWYVDPNSPWVMRYWAADGTPTWSKRSTKTPRDVLAKWKKDPAAARRREEEDRD
ncbi:MAG: hypothetical protein JWO14_1811 [Solirubrobacterales bacterium]|nr:hypothetical protein [Solirubrobacterales bacterium]